MSAEIPVVFVVDDERRHPHVGVRAMKAGAVEFLTKPFREQDLEFGTAEATVKEQRAQVMVKMRAGSVAKLVRSAGRLAIEPHGSGGTPR